MSHPILWLLAMAFVLVGCSASEQSDQPEAPGVNNAAQSAAFPSAAPVVPVEDVINERNDDTLEFRWC